MVVTSPHNRPVREFLATPDTGADTTIVERAQLNSLGFSSDWLQAPLGQGVVSANGQPLDCFGTFHLTFHLGFCSVADRVIVVDLVDGIVLALYVARDLEILPDNYVYVYPTLLPFHAKVVHSQVSETSWDWSKDVVQTTPAQHARAYEQLLTQFLDALRYPADFAQEDVIPPMHGPPIYIHLVENARARHNRCPMLGVLTAKLCFSAWNDKGSSLS